MFSKNSFILKISLILAIFVCLSLSNGNDEGLNVGIVEIESVSTRKEVENFDPQGSIVGGTMVYLKVKNHSMTPSENKIFIGPYPCIIAEKGISGNLISCMTTPQTESDQFWELPVELHVFQKIKSECTSVKGKCVFTYTRNATPYLRHIAPNAGTPDQKVTLNGIWRVENTKEVKKIKIGEDNCNRFDLQEPSERSNPPNLNDDENIRKNQYQNVQCQLSKQQVAGLYQTNFETSYGDLYKQATSTHVTADGLTQYQFAIIGDIKEVNTNTGGEHGNQLVIKGKGFGTNSQNAQVNVGNLNCQIVSITNEEIQCDLEPGSTDQESTDQFMKGQGAQYTRYRLVDTEFDNPQKLRQAIQQGNLENERILSDYTIGSWESVYDDELEQEIVGVYVRGYFKAPRTGKYAFWLSHDNAVQVYLNHQPKNTTIDEQEHLILDKCSFTYQRNYFEPYQCGDYRYQTDNDLQEGEYYWLELYSIANSGTGHFTLSVETPAIPSINPSNTMDAIQQLKIVPQKDNEKWSIKMFNNDQNPFQLYFEYTDPQTRQVFNPKTKEFQWQNQDPQDLVKQIGSLLHYKYSANLLENYKLDTDGNRCQQQQDCQGQQQGGIEIIMEFQNIRPNEGKYGQPLKCNQPQNTCKLQQYQSSSEGLSGTFQMEIEWTTEGGQQRNEYVQVWLPEDESILREEGWYRDIPLDKSIESIKSGLVKLDSSFEDLIVYEKGEAIDGKTYTFNWKRDNNKQMTPNITLNLHNVQGGTGTPYVDTQMIVEQSQSPFHEPIPFDMSFINADLPQIQVKVNDIVSQCTGDCSYQTEQSQTPYIEGFSLNELTLTINLSVNQSLQDEKDLNIQYGGYQCSITNMTDLSNLKCDLEGIEAGANEPRILVQNVGYASQRNSQNITQSIIIESISPQTGSVNGGQTITITGKGFPKSDLKKATVKFGTQIAQVKSTSYLEMKVILPQSQGQNIGQQPITIQYNGQTSNNDIQVTYSDQNVPTISSVEIDDIIYLYDQVVKVNPVKKQLIKINGTNFQNSKDDISVWLLSQNEDGIWEQKYQLNVNLLNNQQQITATISGGRVGEYQLRVYHSTFGYSIQSVSFFYTIEINSISMNQGPKQGGQKMVIEGLNFSPIPGNNQVYFEQDEGNIAKPAQIESQTKSQIVIRVPSMDPSGDITKPWQITVFGRIIEKAVCKDSQDSCEYTYLSGIQTPVVTIQQIQKVKSGDVIQIEGLNLPTQNDTAEAIIQNYENNPISLDLSTSTQLSSLTVPDYLVAGTYQVSIKLESFGIIGVFYIELRYQVIKLLPQVAFSSMGADITLQGTGFTLDSLVSIEGKPCIVRSQTTTEIVCTSPALSDNSVRHSVIIYDKIQKTKCYYCLQYSDNIIPSIQQSLPLSKDSVIEIPDTAFIYQILAHQNFTGTVTAYLQSVQVPQFTIQGNVVQQSNTYNISFDSTDIVAGQYEVKVNVEGRGYAKIQQCQGDDCEGPASFITFILSDAQYESGQQTGVAGGTELVISGKGFNHIRKDLNKVLVCGHQCNIQTVSQTEIQCQLPLVKTQYLFVQDFQFDRTQQIDIVNRRDHRVLISNHVQPQQYFQAIYTSETGDKNVIDRIMDGPLAQNLQNNEFWIELHSHESIKIFIDTLVLNPGRDFNMDHYFDNVKLQARNQNDEEWKDLDIFEAGHLSEYSELQLKVQELGEDAEQNRKSFIIENSYKQFRVLETQASNTNAFATLFVKRMVGDMFYDQDINSDSDFQCQTIVQVNGEQTKIESPVMYKGNSPKVSDISPSFSTYQGSSITIKGEDFGTDIQKVTVLVKGQLCNITNVQNNEIQVTVPAYNSTNDDDSLPIQILIDNIPSVIKKGVNFFPGALLWSHEDTWGGETAPSQDNFVMVPKGQTLVVDQSTPKPLKTVIVEGTLLFDPDLELDIEFDVIYLIIRKGQLIAGTEDKPYRNKLTFTLHGNYFTKQLPEYGNKVIACHECLIDLHGDKIGPHYAILDSTVEKGSNQLIVDREVNWKVGDLIGLVTTDYDGKHSEQLRIENISVQNGKSQIEFSPKLKHKHLSEQEVFGQKTLQVRAELVYLTSNIVIQGNPEDSIKERYGGHLMVHGRSDEGVIARIEGVEFRHTGQPRIIGRYTVHFHMLGDSPNSYVRNIKVHDAYARVVAIHASSHLRVQNNVGFMVPGHNIFLEDGVETNNLIEGNVLVSPRSAFTMLQTDITVAGIWTTNPSNYVRYNIIAGSEFYGMWYEIKERPESRIDLCPHGMPVLELAHNIGHSCQRFGLRFFHLKPRKYPCKDIRNDLLEDPFSENPSIKYTYVNQTSYKNGESGILAEFMGDSEFKDCILADNFRSGFQAHIANFTQAPIILKDSVIVGQSSINGEEVDYISSAILTPRTDGFLAQNVQIYNMPNNTNIVESSSENQNKLAWTQGGYQDQFENVTAYNSSNAGVVRWRGGPIANLIYDKDGSLTETNEPTWIAPYNNHFDRHIQIGDCQNKTSRYNSSVTCQKPIRAVKFSNFQPREDFKGQMMRIFDLQDTSKEYNLTASYDDKTTYGDMFNYIIKNGRRDLDGGYVALLPVNSVYNIHWNQGMDWDHLFLWPSYETELDDETIVLRFPYSEQRESFEIFRTVAGNNTKSYTKQTNISKFFDPDTFVPNNGQDGCVNGDWLQDKENQFLYLCINGKGRDGIKYQQIDINIIYCRDTCESGGFTCEKEQQIRNFLEPQEKHEQTYLNEDLGAMAMAKSPDSEEWEFRVPQEGDDVKIPCEWTMNFNVDSFRFNNLYIDGTLRIEQNSADKRTILATNIWIRGGKLVAGSENSVFEQNLEIILTGHQQSEPLIIDQISQTGTKSLAVTGRLELFGKVPSTTRTRLAQTVQIGENQISVIDDISDWKVGDELALGANHLEGLGYEKVVIQAIDPQTKIITLQQPVQQWHYGGQIPTVTSQQNINAEVNIDEKYEGTLDLRTPIGHLTRNIKIMGNKEETNWGGHLQVYQYIFQDLKTGMDVNARGSIHLQGVELENMGQRGSQNAGVHLMRTNDQEGANEYKETIIQGSSIHGCIGMCFNAINAKYFRLENNIIFSGRRFLIQALQVQQVKILNNYLIGLQERSSVDMDIVKQWDPTALIHMYTPYTPSIDQLQVIGNVGSGSEGIGYAFPGTPYEEKDQNGFINNEVAFCAYTGAMFNLIEDRHYKVGYVQVHSCLDGVTLNNKYSTHGYDAQNMLIAECLVNIKLHSGSEEIVHNSFLTNTWISAVARPSCPDCYTFEKYSDKNSRCQKEIGVILHVVTKAGEHFPWEKSPRAYDVICTDMSAFGSCFLTDVEFHMFKYEYNEIDHPNLSQCQRNYIFENHQSAASATVGTYLRNVTCTDCEKNAFIYIMEPKESWKGWFGGCGQFECSGLYNMLIQDLTGDFLGHEGTITSNNRDIVMAEGLKDLCTYYEKWNAYDCITTDLGILEWDAVSDDFNKLTPVPVYLTNDVFQNKVNMWREWVWLGPEPQNKRLNRYNSLILINQVHNVTYSGSQCVNMVHKLQQRSVQGEIDRYIVIKYHYSTPLALEVAVRGQIIEPWPLNKPGNLVEQNKTDCGANNYFFENNTIHFVITNEPSCQVHVYQKNYLHVNLRMKVTPEEFYGDDSNSSSFINIMAAFLGVDFSQVRIVGVKSYVRRRILNNDQEQAIQEEGEYSEISFIVKDDIPKSQENGYDPKQNYIRLQTISQKIEQALVDQEISLGFNAEFLSAQPKVIKEIGLEAQDLDQTFISDQDIIQTPPDDGQPIGQVKKPQNNDDLNKLNKQKEEKDTLIAIALGVIFGVIGAVTFAVIAYHYWKKKQIKGIKNVSQSEDFTVNEKQAIPSMIVQDYISPRNSSSAQL